MQNISSVDKKNHIMLLIEISPSVSLSFMSGIIYFTSLICYDLSYNNNNNKLFNNNYNYIINKNLLL